MSRDERVNNIKPCTDRMNCHLCKKCTFMGRGNYICNMTNDVVISDWRPTENYYFCEGKDFENICAEMSR